MAKIHKIEEGIDHILEENICLDCKHRFLDIKPANLWLKQLECPNCGKTGFIINTGEVIPNETYEKVCEENPELNIYRKYSWVYQYEE